MFAQLHVSCHLSVYISSSQGVMNRNALSFTSSWHRVRQWSSLRKGVPDIFRMVECSGKMIFSMSRCKRWFLTMTSLTVYERDNFCHVDWAVFRKYSYSDELARCNENPVLSPWFHIRQTFAQTVARILRLFPFERTQMDFYKPEIAGIR